MSKQEVSVLVGPGRLSGGGECVEMTQHGRAGERVCES